MYYYKALLSFIYLLLKKIIIYQLPSNHTIKTTVVPSVLFGFTTLRERIHKRTFIFVCRPFLWSLVKHFNIIFY